MINFKDALITLGILGALVMVGSMSLFAIQGNLIPTSEGNGSWKPRTQFEIKVAEGGDSIYTAMSHVSEEVREEVRGVVYDSPEEALHATSNPLAGNPAFAHAVKVCTHNRNGVVSLNTGGGRHVTWFQGHWNSAHHTRTVHQVLTQNGYQTVATYDWAVARSQCGC
jgi:hypothetical protein